MEAFNLGPNLTGPAHNEGAALSRDVAKGEQVEGEINAFIAKRHAARVKDEGEREVEEAWRERERKDEARPREETRVSRREWWKRLETVYATRSQECAEKAAELEGLGGAA